MRRSLMMGMMIFGLSLAPFGDVAQAQYRPPPVSREEVFSGSDDFREAVDLKRFRKGNAEWDTQELIASGLTALHQDQVRILKELQEIKAGLQQREKKQ
ncbi:MAG: hypothetical protein HY211_03115 [Candidatus Omnitrophica bacterium]|nr:hypothetical protein [Candidatus Omnitrophota bacterium]